MAGEGAKENLGKQDRIKSQTFSGFSVGFRINEEKVICYQLKPGKYLADISTECPDDDWSIQSKCLQVIFRAKVGTR